LSVSTIIEVKGELMVDIDTTSVVNSEEFAARARALAPRFRERAPAAEAARTLPPESVDEMLEAGLARILVPPRFGGHGLGLETYFDVVREIGRGDASHAWCAALMMEIPHHIAGYPLEVQETVWSDGPDVTLAASLLPLCHVTPVDGGYRLSGRSSFTSGVNYASWILLGGMIPTSGPPEWALFLVPREECEVVDTWEVSAMCATGSNTVVTDELFVPGSRALKVADLRDGRTPGSGLHDGPLDRAPLIAWAPLTFVLPMLGAAQGAYEDFLVWVADRTTLGGERVAEMASTQASLGRIAADLDAAELLLRRIAATAQTPEPPSLELRARAMRDYTRSAELIVDAIDALVTRAGTAAFGSSSPLQRAWRDIHFIACHITLKPEGNYAHWGRTALGIERPHTQPFF
jgi:alkylation response protein AidB-like acyl-CoA dehydrogenase